MPPRIEYSFIIEGPLHLTRKGHMEALASKRNAMANSGCWSLTRLKIE